METNKKAFHYTYSAEQQEEIRRIRKRYTAPEEDKMEQVRRLDRQATDAAQRWAIILGVIGALVLGLGMSLAMTDLAVSLGSMAMYLAIPIGLCGILLVSLSYPLYRRILKRQRQRIAPEILRLTDELMK